ncbi:MAG: prephenate dehydratase domain-containing protein [Patescibacteria group bacterium]
MKKAKIIALGPKGSYGHEVAKIVQRWFGYGEICFAPTNVSILQMAESENAIAVIPVENSTFGDVVDVLGYLAKQSVDYSLSVIGQVELPVHHCLMGFYPINELEVIYSHPQAIGQCGESIKRWGVKVESLPTSTSAAAKFVAEHPEKKVGAIGSGFAADEYVLPILERNVQTLKDNETRFLVFGPKQRVTPTGNDKSVIIFQIRNMPGSLLLSLLPFGLLGINMTAIHSVSQGKWCYRFYAEVNGHAEDLRMKMALKVMCLFLEDLLVLGSFPKNFGS